MFIIDWQNVFFLCLNQETPTQQTMTKLNNFMKKLNMAKVNEASSFKYVTKDGEERTYVRKMHSIP